MAYTLLAEGLDEDGIAQLDGRLFEGAIDEAWDNSDALLNVAEA